MASPTPSSPQQRAYGLWKTINAVVFVIGLILPSDGGQILGSWLGLLLVSLLALLYIVLGSPDIGVSVPLLTASLVMLVGLSVWGRFHWLQVNRTIAPYEAKSSGLPVWPLVIFLVGMGGSVTWIHWQGSPITEVRLLAYGLIFLSAVSGLVVDAVEHRSLSND
jgi:hypothetical protein